MKRYMFILIISLLTLVSRGHAETFENIDISQLLENPQSYWAKGIVFRDTFEGSAPKEDDIRINKEYYDPFKTKELGLCYILREKKDIANNINNGDECFFTGTVLQKKRKYVVVINDIKTIVAVKETEKLLKNIRRNRYPGAEPIFKIIDDLQATLVSHAKGNQIDLAELYNPESEEYKNTIQIIRDTVLNKERELRTTSTEILTQLIAVFLVESYNQQYGIPPDATTSEITPQEEVLVVEDIKEKAPNEESVEENADVPEKKSWFQRRREARQKKAEEKRKEREAREKAEKDKKEKEKESDNQEKKQLPENKSSSDSTMLNLLKAPEITALTY